MALFDCNFIRSVDIGTRICIFVGEPCVLDVLPSAHAGPNGFGFLTGLANEGFSYRPHAHSAALRLCEPCFTRSHVLMRREGSYGFMAAGGATPPRVSDWDVALLPRTTAGARHFAYYSMITRSTDQLDNNMCSNDAVAQ